MTITQLQYIIAVAEYQNFTLASEKCFVTQPTLSMQIQKLEEELNIIIFDRSKKPIQVTEVGKKVILQAQKIINESKRMEDVVAQQKGVISGDFNIAIIPTVCSTLLPMFLKHFIKKYPKVNLKIVENTTDQIINDLAKGQLDTAIVATPLEALNIIEKPLYYEPFVAYIPKNHRLSSTKIIESSDLSVEDILMLEDGHCFKDSVLNICDKKGEDKDKKFNFKSGSFETLIRLTNEGLGMTLLPYLHTLELKPDEMNNLHYFKEPSPAREISLIYHQNELKLQLINALHESISEVIRGAIKFNDVKIVSPIRN